MNSTGPFQGWVGPGSHSHQSIPPLSVTFWVSHMKFHLRIGFLSLRSPKTAPFLIFDSLESGLLSHDPMSSSPSLWDGWMAKKEAGSFPSPCGWSLTRVSALQKWSVNWGYICWLTPSLFAIRAPNYALFSSLENTFCAIKIHLVDILGFPASFLSRLLQPSGLLGHPVKLIPEGQQ